MEQALTKVLLENLQSQGYTHLVAEDQLDRDQYTFKPVKWDEATFQENAESSEFDDHMVLAIGQILKAELPKEFTHYIEV